MITSNYNVKAISLKKLAKKEKLNFLPLYFDASNPSTNLGWSQLERKGFLETSALVQIKDKKNKSKDSVFLFNNWMFVSNSTINEIEHPNYDIWLKKCI